MQYVFEYTLPSEMSECSGASGSAQVLQMRYWNFNGEKYLNSSEGQICEDCIDNMTANEWLELFGESLAIAEKEEM